MLSTQMGWWLPLSWSARSRCYHRHVPGRTAQQSQTRIALPAPRYLDTTSDDTTNDDDADNNGAASADAANTELAESRHRQLPSCQSRHHRLVLPKLLIPRGVLRPQRLAPQTRLFSFFSPIDIGTKFLYVSFSRLRIDLPQRLRLRSRCRQESRRD